MIKGMVVVGAALILLAVSVAKASADDQARRDILNRYELKNVATSHKDVERILANYTTDFQGVSVKPGPPIAQSELKNASAFIAAIKSGRDPVSRYLTDQFDRCLGKKNVDWNKPSDLFLKLLDRELDDKLLYTPSRFSHVHLNAEAKALIALKPVGIARARLNRLLLELAYPTQIARSEGTYRFNATSQRAMFAQFYPRMKSFQGTTQITGIQQRGSTAIVHITDHQVFTFAVDQSSPAIIEQTYDDRSVDVWIKTPQGWREKRSSILDYVTHSKQK